MDSLERINSLRTKILTLKEDQARFEAQISMLGQQRSQLVSELTALNVDEKAIPQTLQAYDDQLAVLEQQVYAIIDKIK